MRSLFLLSLVLLLHACTSDARGRVLRSTEVGHTRGAFDMDGPEGGDYDGSSSAWTISVRPFEALEPTSAAPARDWQPLRPAASASPTVPPPAARSWGWTEWTIVGVLAAALAWVVGAHRYLASLGSRLMRAFGRRKPSTLRPRSAR